MRQLHARAVVTGAVFLCAATLPTLLITSPLIVAAVVVGVVFCWAAAGLRVALVAPVFTSVAVATAVVVPMQFAGSAGRMLVPAVAIVCAGVVAVRGEKSRVERTVPVILAVYALVLATSTVLTGSSVSVTTVAEHLLVGAVFAVLGLRLTRNATGHTTMAIVVVGVVETLYAFLEVGVHAPPLWAAGADALSAGGTQGRSELIPGLVRAQGTFGHALPLALFLLVALGLALRHPGLRAWPRAAAVVVLLAGVLTTGSRSAAMIAVLLLLFAPGRQRFVAAVRGVYVLVVGVVACEVGGVFDGQSGVFATFSGTGSWTHRVGALDSIELLLTRQSLVSVWLGNGWRSTKAVSQQGLLQRDGLAAIDNQWVTLLVLSGILGVLLISVVTVTALLKAPAELRPALVAATAMFFVYDVFLWPASWAVWALLIGMTAQRRASPSPDDEVRRLVGVAGLVGGRCSVRVDRQLGCRR